MSAETEGPVHATPPLVLQAIGTLATEPLSGDHFIGAQQDAIDAVTVPQGAENVTARRFGIMATLLKDRFQSLPANITADERRARRDKIREESVRTLFKTFGMLPNNASVDEPFSILYKSAEVTIADRDKSMLDDLYDKYQDHPVIVVIDRLADEQAIVKIPREDFVYMKRVSLYLIANAAG